ncbi:MAG: hypothetical protein CL600_10345 [Alteromonas sp.]|uniref:SapC family protein n=1 Tax=Alteromonas sp. MB-3u-76 TaxID=2058133 RepID=UPI000C307FD8|nr:SapC family protein [Alteromonas sp. MB-3u-76]AUC89880.1 hypothetical protein CW735_18200 [Alteromonas sp. MB-3u-76]MAI65257.1 hypothetical protein [Alteromonas sp.]
MAHHVLLNNVEHKDVKIAQSYQHAFGHDQMCVPVFPVEVRHAQACYPLVFAKDAQENFQMVALLGLEQNENLFLKDGEWNASYKPLLVEKGPFLIGRNTSNAESGETLSIHIDMEDPRVIKGEDGASDSVSVFLPHGGNSEYIDNIANVLSTIHESQAVHKEFIDAMTRYDLVESFVVDINLDGNGTNRLSGFYTVNEDKLNDLDAEALFALNQKGHLSTVFMMLASMSQLSKIVDMKKAVL